MQCNAKLLRCHLQALDIQEETTNENTNNGRSGSRKSMLAKFIREQENPLGIDTDRSNLLLKITQ